MDTSALTPPGSWRIDPDALRNGVIPASALINQTSPEDLDILQVSRKADGDWQTFLDYKKSDDQIWNFREVLNAETGEARVGLAIVSNKRPVAILEIKPLPL